MQRLEVSCALRRLYRSLGVKGLILLVILKNFDILTVVYFSFWYET